MNSPYLEQFCMAFGVRETGGSFRGNPLVLWISMPRPIHGFACRSSSSVYFSLLLCHNGVEGSMGLSEEEYLELEKQIELLNKPTVKTIHMKPTSSAARRTRDKVASNGTKPVSMHLRGEGCHLGTVPMRRVTGEDLIREKLAPKTMAFEENTLGAHFVHDTTKKFNGAGACIHRPHVIDEEGQCSAARVKIQNGGYSTEAGWRASLSTFS